MQEQQGLQQAWLAEGEADIEQPGLEREREPERVARSS
jgi:hypothetical protein